MKQSTLSKKEIKEINSDIKKIYGIEEFFDKTNNVFLLDDEYVMSEGMVIFFYHEEKLIPTLHLLLKDNFLKKIEINQGAIPFIAKGADLMRPGITSIDPGVKEGEIVSIIDDQHNKPIAVGETLFSKEELEPMEAGKVVLNIHHVGDEVWNIK